ncbi:hypothetical protein C922_00189 [Plasmodium inui San Antonio 1]|uniref:Uncharacterized protein n=1 Tax=Plasmodium inui San Antonio 1 TaxID=1237626 RepID=W7AV86_9APIC|nr:hypothetical protein C922_00189 [Plasmodium inui San Antonio 1]EUD69326.1 hypothetical protein C922_00189 [Plasmodium inui San Antonio 1]
MKLKRQVIFAKGRKFSQGGRCRFILTNSELQRKLKNNNHLIRLIKDVIPSEHREKGNTHEDDGQITQLGFSYLYKNVSINKVGKRKVMSFESPGEYSDDLISNLRNEHFLDWYHDVGPSHHKVVRSHHEVVLNHDDGARRGSKHGSKHGSRGNTKEVYSYVMNSLKTLTPQQVLLTLHSFLLHGLQVEHLEKINEHVVNNIYNFKTSELILIHLFYVFFEGSYGNGVASESPGVAGRQGASVASRDAATSCDTVTSIEPPFGKDEHDYHYDDTDHDECSASLHMTNHGNHKIRTLAKELTRYTSHLFYKRRQHLLLNEIEEILFIWSKYNLYHRELFDHCVRVIERSMHSLKVENMEFILKGESSPLMKIRKESLHDLNKFDLLIKCFYHLSGIRKVTLLEEIRLKYFSQVANFLGDNFALLTQLPLRNLFMLLQVGEVVARGGDSVDEQTEANCQMGDGDRLKFHLLSLIEEKLKKANQDDQCGRRMYPQEGSKNMSKCVQVLDAVSAYYSDVCNPDSHCIGVKQPPSCGGTDQSCEKAQTVGETSGGAPTDASLPKMSNTGNAVNEPKNLTHRAGSSHIAIPKHGGRDQTGMFHFPPKLTFLSSINEYIAVGCEPCKKYLPTFLSILKGEKKFQHMLLYFINHLDKRSDANVLLPYIKLICEYVGNIYVLSYMGYLYKCAITSKDFFNRANFNLEKVAILLSTLHRRIGSDHKILQGGEHNGNTSNVSPNGITTFHQNNERFVAFLRESNPNVYEHVQANLLNLNLKEIKKLDEFLFHYAYKHMVNDTFEYLENIIPYINRQRSVNHLLWLFVQINNYYSVYSKGRIAPRGVKIATLFFQKICILNFLSTYQDRSDNCYEAVKNILTYVRLEKDVERALSNYVLNLYFKKYTALFGNEDMFVYITDILQKLSNCSCVLTYQNDGTFLICSHGTDQLSGPLVESQIRHIINTLIQNNCCAHLINLLLLANAGVSFGTLFGGIRNHLYSYAF